MRCLCCEYCMLGCDCGSMKGVFCGVYGGWCEGGVMFGDVMRLHRGAWCYVLCCPNALDCGSVYCVGQVGFSVVVLYYVVGCGSISRWPFGSPDF
jgi:hypothetical protein